VNGRSEVFDISNETTFYELEEKIQDRLGHRVGTLKSKSGREIDKKKTTLKMIGFGTGGTIKFSGTLTGGMPFGESSEDELPETLGDLDEEEEQKQEGRLDMMSQEVYRSLCRKKVCLNDETRAVHNFLGCPRCDNRWCHMQNEPHDRAECGSVPNQGRGKGGAHFNGVEYLRGAQRQGKGGVPRRPPRGWRIPRG
jgi:hypothetical protein